MRYLKLAVALVVAVFAMALASTSATAATLSGAIKPAALGAVQAVFPLNGIE